jgi:predicted permease
MAYIAQIPVGKHIYLYEREGVFLAFNFEKSYWQNMLKVMAIRYTLGISIGAILFFLLPFNSMFRYTLLLGLILPIGLTVIPYSVQFGYDRKYVGTVTNFTIVIRFVLMWIVFSLAVV